LSNARAAGAFRIPARRRLSTPSGMHDWNRPQGSRTTEGFGEDLQSAGEEIEEEAEDASN